MGYLKRYSSNIASHWNVVPRTNEQPFYGSLIQDDPGELVLSQRTDLLEQPLDFYEPDVLTAAQPIVSK